MLQSSSERDWCSPLRTLQLVNANGPGQCQQTSPKNKSEKGMNPLEDHSTSSHPSARCPAHEGSASDMCQQTTTKAKQDWIFQVNLMHMEQRQPLNLLRKGDLHANPHGDECRLGRRGGFRSRDCPSEGRHCFGGWSSMNWTVFIPLLKAPSVPQIQRGQADLIAQEWSDTWASKEPFVHRRFLMAGSQEMAAGPPGCCRRDGQQGQTDNQQDTMSVPEAT